MQAPSPWTTALFVAAIAACAIGIAVTIYILGRNPPTHTPRLGQRGLKRQRALDAGGSFAAIEPAMRLVAGWVAHFPIQDARRKIDVRLVHAGDYLGLTADEFVALCLVSAAGFGLAAGAAVTAFQFPPIVMFFAILLGYFAPNSQLAGEINRRFKQANRQLPAAIDLAALCMGAGLDFPGSLRQIVEKTANKSDTIAEEFGRILQELDLGRTRRQALENFAERVPTDAVRDFVAAVVQAEEKGNPLAEILRIQADMLRMRRSVMAEELAAKAAIALMAPLMLIFCAILLILMGPFVVQGMKTGF